MLSNVDYTLASVFSIVSLQSEFFIYNFSLLSMSSVFFRGNEALLCLHVVSQMSVMHIQIPRSLGQGTGLFFV